MFSELFLMLFFSENLTRQTYHRRSNSHTETITVIEVPEPTVPDENCGWRLRLTPSAPKQVGCAW